MRFNVRRHSNGHKIESTFVSFLKLNQDTVNSKCNSIMIVTSSTPVVDGHKTQKPPGNQNKTIRTTFLFSFFSFTAAFYLATCTKSKWLLFFTISAGKKTYSSITSNVLFSFKALGLIS